MLNSAIVNKLKTGTIKNVILFADSMMIPPPPYAVVKPENGAIPGTRQYRIIVHIDQGLMDELERYVFVELAELLESQTLEDEEGRFYKLKSSGEWTDVRVDPYDQAIYMERVFYIPFRIA